MTDTANRVLDLAEVMALEEGARVWVDNQVAWEHYDGIHVVNRNAPERAWLINERLGGGWPESSYREHLNVWFRVWSLPQPPTHEELNANPWEVQDEG